jgi:hypothetical protein
MRPFLILYLASRRARVKGLEKRFIPEKYFTTYLPQKPTVPALRRAVTLLSDLQWIGKPIDGEALLLCHPIETWQLLSYQ